MRDSPRKLDQFTGHTVDGALRFRNDLSVGMPAPEFALKALDNATVHLAEYRWKSHVVLIFGSLTCGSTVTQLRDGRPALGSLCRRFKRKGFEFFLIYTREVHRGENVPQAEIYQQRLGSARRLMKEEKYHFRFSSITLTIQCVACTPREPTQRSSSRQMERSSTKGHGPGGRISN